MSKRGAIVIHILLIIFLAGAWFMTRRAPAAAEPAATEPLAVVCPDTAAPAACEPAPTYTPLPTYTPYPTATAVPVPTATATPEPSPTPDAVVLREEFDGQRAPGWRLFNAQEWGFSFDLVPGALTLTCGHGMNCCPDQGWENLLLHPLPTGNYQVETKMTFAPIGGETAGLVLCNGPTSCAYYGKNQKYLPTQFLAKDAEETYLRLRREGDKLTFSASLDGSEWVEVGTDQAQDYEQVGLVATQGEGTMPSMAAFDYFTIERLP